MKKNRKFVIPVVAFFMIGILSAILHNMVSAATGETSAISMFFFVLAFVFLVLLGIAIVWWAIHLVLLHFRPAKMR